MEDMNFYHKHYIKTDDRGRITAGFSDAFCTPAADDICVNEHGGRHFRLVPGGEDNPELYELTHMIPLYKYEGGEVIRRTQDEIDADISELPDAMPSQLDRVEAQVTYTAMMTDTLLEG